MKIGLVRHFKVSRGLPGKGWFSPENLVQWFSEYELSDIEPNDVYLGNVDWEWCYCSTIERARKTAHAIYTGNITELDGLREIAHPDFRKISRMRLPFLLWIILVRLCWYSQHRSIVEKKEEVTKRICHAIDTILLSGKENVLIVSHAGLMMEIRKELKKRGFLGPSFGGHAKNGFLYLFERK